ncbi:hypothetical protein SDC9_157019 [bioreactor metagenome]|uniref:TMhelix containing protein n=2 Tax=root TaxID=1 RepID=A0A0X1U7Z6_ANAPI|nr:hypothetical protein [Anaerotignum propionicum]AMJ41066.1 hypothetical protein CPRO_14730 [Anaerotignum propionicum DSM 1682]SHE62658.1 hypothetical protein SAMN02745151_01284 [[Clostridium] propionicum DSM 1682] [Anaerotignum propionicum DSM 1682]
MIYIFNAILGGVIYYIHYINTIEKEKVYAKVNAVLIAIFIWCCIGSIGSLISNI